ncbi:MORN motif [Trypanosoma melophagium]|uniref:MORN motif n=1 Tax=Trypanosoma melophagium TaxID=715481 RepID=UPI00351A6A52|nr:MORN motif [Trypanosoma melophagium]
MSLAAHASSTSSKTSPGEQSLLNPLAFPPNGAAILQQSLEMQRAAMLSLDMRSLEGRHALQQKRSRLQVLRKQIERRQEMEIIDQQASLTTQQLLTDLTLAIHERQTRLRPEGYQSFVFENGDVYEGNWKGCRMHGTGYMKRVEANDLYEGEWFLGLRNGTGACHSPDFGTFYSGKWQDGKWHGRGELVEPEGMYMGEFVDGRLEGYGEYVYNDGHVYKGEWINGLYEGQGTYLVPIGGKYEGHWIAGREHGRGTLTFFNGDTYVGEWHHGLRHGVGVYSSAFLQYDGDWCHDAVHGKGKCRYADGSMYEGEWLNAMFHGEGKYINQAQKQSYEGGFRYGKREGWGVYRSEDVEYSGEWRDDKKHGKGEMKIKGGGTFCGTWHNELPHGEGIYTANGETKHVVYEYGKCVSVTGLEEYQKVNLRFVLGQDKPGTCTEK